MGRPPRLWKAFRFAREKREWYNAATKPGAFPLRDSPRKKSKQGEAQRKQTRDGYLSDSRARVQGSNEARRRYFSLGRKMADGQNASSAI